MQITAASRATPRIPLHGEGMAVSLTSRANRYQWTPPMMLRTMVRKVRNIRHFRMAEEYTRPPGSDPPAASPLWVIHLLT